MGVTINVPLRLIQLRSEYPDLEVLGVMAGSFSEKTRLHQRFPKQRIRRTDWFRDCDELRAFIQDNATLNWQDDSPLTAQIDIPLSLSPGVRTLLERYLTDLQREHGNDSLTHSDALQHIFEQHLPHYIQKQAVDEPAGD